MSSQARTLRAAEAVVVEDNPTVLVVDDDVFLRLEVEDAFAGEGFTVLSAADADAAERLLQQHPEIALLVTDVQMPGSMDGVALARSVLSQRPEIKVIIMSAYWRPGGDMVSAHAVLEKPFPATAVIKHAQRLLG
jgi:two-component system, response regulator PdtaR